MISQPQPLPSMPALSRRPARAPSGPILLALTAATLGSVGTVQAENWPVYISGSQRFTHDSNLFRRETNVVSDTVSSTAVTVGLDKAYGRQNYQAALTANTNRYSDNDQLNYNGFNADAGFSTTIGQDLFLSASFNRSRSLATFDTGTDRRVAKNIRNNGSEGASLRYGLYGRMSLGLSASHFSEDYTATSTSYPKQRSSSYAGDVRYTPQPELSLSVGLRHSPGRTTYDQTLNSNPLEFDTRTNNVDFSVGWAVSGLSTLDARLSYTKQDQSPVSGNSTLVGKDFKGWTGALNWKYTPRGLLSYRVGFSRDTTNNASLDDYQRNPTIALVDNRLVGFLTGNSGDNRVTTRLTGGIDWQATAKIKAGVDVGFSRLATRLTTAQTVQDVFGGVERTIFTTRTQTGNLNTIGLSASYAAQRWLSFDCSVQHLKRTRDLYSLAYDATVFGCSASATLNAQN